MPQLVGINSSLLDNWSPSVDLGLEVRAQRRWRRAVFSYRLGAEITEALLHRRIPERILQSLRELIDHRLRCAFRRIERVPNRYFKTFQSGLVHGRNIR